MTGNTAAWIILLVVACAVAIAVPAGLWVSWRRERRRAYHPAHKVRPGRKLPIAEKPGESRRQDGYVPAPRQTRYRRKHPACCGDG